MTLLQFFRISKSWPTVTQAFRNASVLQKVLSTKLRTSEFCRYASSGLYDDDDDDDDYQNSRARGIYNKDGFSRRGGYDEDLMSHEPHRSFRTHGRSNQYGFKKQYNQRSFENQGWHGGATQEVYDDNAYYETPRNNDFRKYSSQYGSSRTPGYRHPGIKESFGESITPAKFDENDLPEILKNVYSEHPNVTSRALENVENFRRSAQITVRGTDIPKPICQFAELNIPEYLMKIVNEQDYKSPTPIQCQGWPIVLSGRDMVGISQTGSGKTLVYMLPAAVHIKNQQKNFNKQQSYDFACQPQALILAPTRELAQQIHHVGQQFHINSGVRNSCIYGGASKFVQQRNMRGSNMCIATPGRLIDFLSSGVISLKSCTYLVLDEADRMLDMGFEPQIRKIISQIRPDRQTLMWSATWPREVRHLAEDFLTEYVQVTVGSGELVANPNIEQKIHVVSQNQKLECLSTLLNEILLEPENKTLVFAQTKRTVDYLTRCLNDKGIRACGIHGDISQAGRDRVLSRFRSAKSCVLIATDVAARGLDVDTIRFVVNYDFPSNTEDYIHRIGRTARGTNTGTAHSFFTYENASQAKELITILEQAGQQVSDDLLEMANSRSLPRNSTHNRGWYNNRHTGYRKQRGQYSV